MPPSAITGTLCRAAAAAHSATDVIIGTPMPATMRVVQIEPAPMPTLTASTPRSISASVASPVATLPATRSTFGKVRRSVRHHVEHALRVAVRGVDDQHVDVRVDQRLGALARCRGRCRRRRRSAAGPASPCRRSGYLIAFWMSLTVIRPFSRKSWSTTRSFSTLAVCRISRAWSSVVPTGTVNSRSLVITSATGAIDVGLEAQVAVGEDADQAAFLAAVLGDRHARDAVAAHQLERLEDPGGGGERDRVDDHAALGALHAIHLGAPAARSAGSCG